MRRPILLMLAVAMTVVLLARSAAPVHACQCAVPYPTPADYTGFLVGQASVIVVGTVVEFGVEPPFDPQSPDQPYQAIATFPVEEYLKASGPETLALNAYGLEVDENGDVIEAGLAGCQMFSLQSVGLRFVLFFPEGSALNSDPSYCGGSAALEGAAGDKYLADIRVALQPATPTPEPSPSPPPLTPTPRDLPQTGGSNDSDGVPRRVAGATLVMLLVGTSLLWRHRRAAP